MKKPLTVKQFNKILSDNKPHDFAIALSFGLYSVKTVTLFKNGVYKIYNHIDETTQKLAEYQIANGQYNNISKAIDKKALFLMN